MVVLGVVKLARVEDLGGDGAQAGGAVTRAVAWEGTHVAPGERVQDSVAAPGVRMES